MSFHHVELQESQLRELVNARSTWRSFLEARAESGQVKGSMVWKAVSGHTYLIRKSATGSQKSLGPRSAQTEEMFASFQARKERAQARLRAMKARAEEQRKLNRLYRVGRVPNVVVRTLAALDAAGLGDKFLVIGTHAIYAYEAAAGVLVASSALATRDLDLLFDTRKRLAFLTTLRRSEARSLLQVLQKADPSFRVLKDQMQTAVNDDGFEVDIIRRQAKDGDPHPLRMSDDEGDFWAAQISQGEQIVSARRFDSMVVSASGEMAIMRTLHPLDFIRLKRQLARRVGRGVKASKDRHQAEVVHALWEQYLRHLEPPVG